MGQGNYNYTSSQTRANVRQQTGQTAFVHNTQAQQGLVPKLHEDLNILGKRRESRDVPGKQPATPLMVMLDETGSMHEIPGLVLADLPKLMKNIIERGVVTDPQICFGAIGDANSGSRFDTGGFAPVEAAPIQIGQFEADDEKADGCLANIYLEGSGGGQGMETYDLALYYAARCVDADAWEKRGQKGYLFLVGDEGFYPKVFADNIRVHIDPTYNGEDIPTKVIIEEAQQKFHVFLIRPGGTHYFNNTVIQSQWREILGNENVLQMEKWQGIVPLIGGTISLMEGADMDDTIAGLANDGFDANVLKGVKNALVPLSATATSTVAGLIPVGAGAGDNLPTTTACKASQQSTGMPFFVREASLFLCTECGSYMMRLVARTLRISDADLIGKRISNELKSVVHVICKNFDDHRIVVYKIAVRPVFPSQSFENGADFA